jgi:glycosyltransferase involved in cell wall biosynthesis
MRLCMNGGILGKNWGGPPRSVPQLCGALAAKGAEVSLVYSPDPAVDEPWNPTQNPAVRQLVHPAVRLPLLKSPAFPGLEDFLVRHCGGGGADLIHDNGTWLGCNRAAAAAAARCGLPLVLTPRGMLTRWAIRFKPLKKRLGWLLYQRAICRQARLLHATSVEEAVDLRALGLDNPIAIIANGTAIPRFTGPRPAPGGRRRRLLFLSRIHPKKGLLGLLQALARLKAPFERGRWVLTIAGPDEGGHLAEVRREAGRLGLERLVEYSPFVDGAAKWDLYRSSDLFVLPTFSENFGIVIAEALGCGVPVITTEGTPWAELVSHRCGWWHPLGQEHLEAALADALGTPSAALRAMGARGRALVRDRYEWPGIASRFMQAYGFILDRGPKPDFVYGPADPLPQFHPASGEP